jgi:aryl-alcohol dehydrogenase-like predicted oxidoreductase
MMTTTTRSESSIALSTRGVNFVDTADVYSRGESEEIVGKALQNGRRDGLVLATKVHGSMGDDPNQRGNSRHWIVMEVENSLRRLRTDWIDLYQIHRPDPDTDTSAPRPFRRARSSRRSGLRRAGGASASCASSRRIRSSLAPWRRTCSQPVAATAWA